MNAIIAQRWKILAEVKVNAKVNAKGVAIVSRVGQHLVLGKGMFVGRACVEAVVIIRDEKYAAVRLRLVDQEAVTNRVESTRRRRFSSEEPPLWARELLSQQKKNADELRRLRSKVAKTLSEGSLTASKVVDQEF